MLLLTTAGTVPDVRVAEPELKVEFIERFTRFVEWPGAGPGPFVIGVLGRSPLEPYLRDLARARQVKGRPLHVRAIADLEDVGGVHLLFIPSSEETHLRRVLARTDGRAILTVGDTAGFAEAGVILNFYTAGETLRFEVNEAAAQRSGLVISAKLLRLARRVHSGP